MPLGPGFEGGRQTWFRLLNIGLAQNKRSVTNTSDNVPTRTKNTKRSANSHLESVLGVDGVGDGPHGAVRLQHLVLAAHLVAVALLLVALRVA